MGARLPDFERLSIWRRLGGLDGRGRHRLARQGRCGHCRPPARGPDLHELLRKPRGAVRKPTPKIRNPVRGPECGFRDAEVFRPLPEDRRYVGIGCLPDRERCCHLRNYVGSGGPDAQTRTPRLVVDDRRLGCAAGHWGRRVRGNQARAKGSFEEHHDRDHIPGLEAIPGRQGLVSQAIGHVREFIFVTHTRWDEAPRIRHQLARLLAGIGHWVLFVERADGPLAQVKDGATEVEPGIFRTRTNRLLHHQLRVVAPLDRANEAIVCPHLIRQVKASGVAPDATVINFTHDYCFLRKGDANAVEMPNKMLQLLAYGLSIVKTGMPNAVKAEFIMSVETDPTLDAALDDCFRNFSCWQPSIRSFLAQHTAEARLTALRIEPGG